MGASARSGGLYASPFPAATVFADCRRMAYAASAPRGCGTIVRKFILTAFLAAALAGPAWALESGSDCHDEDGGEPPFIWNGDEWLPNPLYVWPQTKTS